jgi:hypothetical protein
LGKPLPGAGLPLKGRRLTYAADPPVPAEVLEQFAAREEKHLERERRYGQVQPIVHVEFGGHQIVGVGNEVHWNKSWKTFPDFLSDYVKTVFGKSVDPEWGKQELRRPFEERHPLMQWYQHYCDFQAAHPPGPGGVGEGVPDGSSRAYLLVAYDLYLIKHHVGLQEALVRRLSNPDQFQGARYELAVAALLVRAGCTVEYEDERDNTKKHPEFTVTHQATNEVFAVEAKSRHRHGVLGFEGKPAKKEEVAAGIEGLFKAAVRKEPGKRFFIFIDANLPPDHAWEHKEVWTQEINQMLQRVASGWGDVGVFEGAVHNALYVTNFADHYGKPGERYPGWLILQSLPTTPKHPMRFRDRICSDIVKAAEQYGRIPNGFDE